MDYLLRALLVDGLRLMLGRLAVLPNKTNDQFFIIVLLASVNLLNLILPRSRRRTPLLQDRRQSLIAYMRLISFQSLGPCAGSVICRQSTLFGVGRFVRFLDDLVPPTYRVKILIENLVARYP